MRPWSEPSEPSDVTMSQLVDLGLPSRGFWYLTSNGTDYGVPAAVRISVLVGPGRGRRSRRRWATASELFVVGVDALSPMSDDMLDGLRGTAVTRLIHRSGDRRQSGDVYGKILRLAPMT